MVLKLQPKGVNHEGCIEILDSFVYWDWHCGTCDQFTKFIEKWGTRLVTYFYHVPWWTYRRACCIF
jgi:hypothetical protein